MYNIRYTIEDVDKSCIKLERNFKTEEAYLKWREIMIEAAKKKKRLFRITNLDEIK